MIANGRAIMLRMSHLLQWPGIANRRIASTLSLHWLKRPPRRRGEAAFVQAAEVAEVLEARQLLSSTLLGPTLSSISTLGTAYLQTPFNINYATLLGASNAADSNGQPIQFRVNSIQNGTLSIVHNSVTSAVVASPTNGTLLASGDTLVWTSPAGLWGSGVNAFSVTAFDGSLNSVPAVQVKINVSSWGSQFDLSGAWLVVNPSGVSEGLGNVS
jgi:hypothetical protein